MMYTFLCLLQVLLLSFLPKNNFYHKNTLLVLLNKNVGPGFTEFQIPRKSFGQHFANEKVSVRLFQEKMSVVTNWKKINFGNWKGLLGTVSDQDLIWLLNFYPIQFHNRIETLDRRCATEGSTEVCSPPLGVGGLGGKAPHYHNPEWYLAKANTV